MVYNLWLNNYDFLGQFETRKQAEHYIDDYRDQREYPPDLEDFFICEVESFTVKKVLELEEKGIYIW